MHAVQAVLDELLLCEECGWVPFVLRAGRPTCLIGRRMQRYPHIDKDGYRRIWHNGRGVGEHRVIMSQILGRELLPGEEAHHKNGVRHDNRPENLELWVVSQPAGQRAEDLVVWAREILERYEGFFSDLH